MIHTSGMPYRLDSVTNRWCHNPRQRASGVDTRAAFSVPAGGQGCAAWQGQHARSRATIEGLLCHAAASNDYVAVLKEFRKSLAAERRDRATPASASGTDEPDGSKGSGESSASHHSSAAKPASTDSSDDTNKLERQQPQQQQQSAPSGGRGGRSEQQWAPRGGGSGGRGQYQQQEGGRGRSGGFRQQNPAAGRGRGSAQRFSSSGEANIQEAESYNFFRQYRDVFFLDRTIEKSSEGFPPGYFLCRFKEAGLLDADGKALIGIRSAKEPKADSQVEAREGMRPLNDPLRIGINTMITNSTRWQTVERIAQDIAHLLDPINLSTAMHRIAKLSRKYESEQVRASLGYALLIGRVQECIDVMIPRQLANVFWAAATVMDRRPWFSETVAQRVRTANLHKYKQQELSMIMWSFGVMGHKDEEVLDAILDEMLSQGLGTFLPQALSNGVWACATLEHVNPKMLQALCKDIVQRPGEFTAQGLANTVWSITSLGYSDPDGAEVEMLEAVAAEAMGRLEEFNSQEMSNLLISFARMELVNVPLLDAVCLELAREGRLTAFSPQAIANSLWAFATLRYICSKECLNAMLGQISRVSAFKEQELVNITWSFAKLGLHPGPVLADICRRIERMASRFGTRATTSSLWALSVLQASREKAFVALTDRMAQITLSNIDPVQLNQLFQALMLAQVERGSDLRIDLLDAVPKKIQEHGEAMWKSSVNNTRVSKFHQDVSATLLRIRVSHLVEYVTPDRLFSVDIALRNGQQPIALEVDGARHFSSNTQQPLGHTLLRRRLLRSKGWVVLRVPHYEWRRLLRSKGWVVLSVPHYEWYEEASGPALDDAEHSSFEDRHNLTSSYQRFHRHKSDADKELYLIERLGSIGIDVSRPEADEFQSYEQVGVVEAPAQQPAAQGAGQQPSGAASDSSDPGQQTSSRLEELKAAQPLATQPVSVNGRAKPIRGADTVAKAYLRQRPRQMRLSLEGASNEWGIDIQEVAKT